MPVVLSIAHPELAQRALDMKLISDVIPHGELMDRAVAVTRKIAKKPPEILRMAKRLIYKGQRSSMPDLTEPSATTQPLCHHGEDHMEALNAFFEKGRPRLRESKFNQ